VNLIAELAVGCNHDCAACPAVELGFQEDPKTGRLLKFPPGIGSQSAAPILLIGFNPGLRVDLQRQIMADRNAFTQLALNRLEGLPYIAPDGKERHYRSHARIVKEAIRGTDYEGSCFEDVAVATELFLCATKKPTSGLRRALADGSAKCPDLYFWNVLFRAQPKLVVTLGNDVLSYVRRSAVLRHGLWRIDSPTQPVIIAIPHPARRTLSDVEIGRVGEACRAVLRGGDPREWDFRRRLTVGTPATGTERQHSFHWTDKKGWHVTHRVEDLDWLEADATRSITYYLYRDGALRFTMKVTGRQLRSAIGAYVDGPRWPETGYNNPVTRQINGVRTQVFLPKWAPYVSAAE